MECKFCGAEVRGRFCSYCGRKIIDEFNAESEARKISDHNLGADFEIGTKIDVDMSNIYEENHSLFKLFKS